MYWERPPGEVRAVVGICARTHPKPATRMVESLDSGSDPPSWACGTETVGSGWVCQAGWAVPDARCGRILGVFEEPTKKSCELPSGWHSSLC